ncbi:MAG: AraC family transcriptional regulator [Clostridia bacterium]|nr:AraC family transcriptional regulator [Clostridia bacterium]
MGDEPYFISYVKASYPQHCHNEIEFIYCVHGDAKVIVEEKEYILKENDILCIDSLAMHQIELENDTGIFDIEFGAQFVGAFFQEFAQKCFGCPHITHDSNSVYAVSMREIVQRIYEEYLNSDEATAWAMRGYLNELFTLLMRSVPMLLQKNSQRQKQLERYMRIQKVFDFVKNNYSEPISLAEAANLVGYDPNAFCRIFKEITNSSFHQYLNIFRVNIAMRLLTNKNMSIGEIGQQVGIPVAKTFGRVFKTYTGMSPREYRQCIFKEIEPVE